MDPLSVIFGLTGGLACGKTTVARMFEQLGARIIDADRMGHELLGPTLPTYRAIVKHFGGSILNAAGEIDRQRLGAVVFTDPAKLRTLNAILHPPLLQRVQELAAGCLADDPSSVVIVDAALIYEAEIAHRFRKVLVAWCRPAQQLARLMAKAGLSREEAERRIASQMSPEEKRRRADYVIDCSGSIEETRRQVGNLFPELRLLASSEARGS